MTFSQTQPYHFAINADFRPEDSVFYHISTKRINYTIPAVIESVGIRKGGEVFYYLKDLPPAFQFEKNYKRVPQGKLSRRWID